MYILAAYVAYLAIGLGVTVWVARTLHRNGRAFLVDAFQGNAELADSVNHLLVVGFYLVNLGYLALFLRAGATPLNSRQAIELVCDKIGAVLLVLGIMHFLNIFVFNRLRRHGQARARQAQTPPRQGWTPHSAPIGKVLD
ncbi:MAG TPA: hypothetical protein VGS58_06755 [Candidatus Sulfopaludibacter sp.]|nr:hypothetical protein [Candidatus Sulfopaludibacter sp.]